MGRPKKPRKHFYKQYYDKDEDSDVPESTLRYSKKNHCNEENEDASSSHSSNRDGSAQEFPGSSHHGSDEAEVNETHSQSSIIDDDSLEEEVSKSDYSFSNDSDTDLGDSFSPHTLERNEEANNVRSEAESSNSSQVSDDSFQESRGTSDEDSEIYDRPSSSASYSSNQFQEEFHFAGFLQDTCDTSDGEIDNSSQYSKQDSDSSDVDTHTDCSLNLLRNSCQTDWEESNSEMDNPDSFREDEREDGQDERDQERLDQEDDEEEQEDEEDQERLEQGDGEQEQDKENFSRLKGSLQSLKGTMDLQVNISLGELFINALTLVKKHNWSHLEKEHLMKFVNSILKNGNIVPDSRYLLDQLFYSKNDMHYYFFCSNCFKLLGSAPANELRPERIVCTCCETVNILSDLSKASYFVRFHLPSQIDILLSDTKIRSKLLNPIDFTDLPLDNIMRDLHHGSMYREFANFVKSNDDLSNKRVMSFTLCIDSAALCHTSSGLSICPVQVMINELPIILRTGNPLLAGLWFGAKKEKMDLILPPIVNHITQLSLEGFDLVFDNEQWQCKTFLIACCVDSGARYDVQGIHSHRGEFCCSWCLVEGEEWNGVRIFRYTEVLPPPRSIEELVEDAEEALRTNEIIHGVKYLSPLAAAPLFHPVHGFIVDAMHAKDEGTTKSFLKAWLGEFGNQEYYIGAPVKKKKIELRMKKIKPPKELRHNIKMLSDFAYWTGRQLENWALFISVPVLIGILPERYLKHWALFVQASHILLSKELLVAAIDIAEGLIEEFCRKAEGLYNLFVMRFNFHIARHFPENARRWAAMFALTAYGFEHGNQVLKNTIHSAQFIPNQVCRSLSEENALCLLKLHCGTLHTESFEDSINRKVLKSSIELPGNIRLLHYAKTFHATEEEAWFINRMRLEPSDFQEYSELEKEGCHFGTSPRSKNVDNSYARLKNKNIVYIRKVLFHEISRQAWVVSSRVRCEPSSYCPNSVVQFDRNLCFLFAVTVIDQDIEFHEVSDLDIVCVSTMFDDKHFISPMPNIFNMF